MADQKPLTKLPPGVLPAGIQLPPGTDIMQFCRDLAESGADFAEQFDRDSATFHHGLTTAVPMGGERVPETMGGAAAADWRSLPEAPVAIEQDFGPEHDKVVQVRQALEKCKKAISVVNKPVEMVMKLRVQYKGAEGDDKTALESRLKGAENDRDGALQAATELLFNLSDEHVSDRTRSTVQEVVERGKFQFEDMDTFGEYMQVLQRANQAIFADQKKLLQKIKDIKKEVVAGKKAEGGAEALMEKPIVAVGGA